MKKEIEVEFMLTGDELAEELWSMDDNEQAEFLCEVARTLENNVSSFHHQLLNISDNVNYGKMAPKKASIIQMLETVLEYIKEEGDPK